MKIGYLLQAGAPDVQTPPFSGPATHVRQVIFELKNLGHTVRLLAYRRGQIWKSDEEAGLLEGFEPVRLPTFDHGPVRIMEKGIRRIQSSLRLPYAGLFESLRFASACARELSGYDILYERMGWMGYGGGLAARRLGIPLILEVNGDPLIEMEKLGIAPRGAQRWLSFALVRESIRNATHLVASGEGWRDHFLKQWNLDAKRVTVVENGTEQVDLLERSQLRAFAPLSNAQDLTRLVYVGGFQAWQGVPVLIRALALSVAQGARVCLTLIGDGPGLEEAKQSVAAHNLERYVSFTGHLSSQQLAAQLANADIGLSPYCGHPEFSGLKLLDYKAAGLAILASGQDGQPSILDHGRTAWIVPPCDENALANAILHLVHNPGLRQQLGRQARQDAESLHRWRHTAEQLVDVFNRLVNL